nr:HEAT repeat domain-containing protein [Actinomycetota bacterium]
AGRAVAANPAAPPAAVEIPRDAGRMRPIAAILANPGAFGEAGLRPLAGSPFPRYRWTAAENPKTPPDVLDALAADEGRVPGRYIGHWNPIRMAVAANRSTPVDTIARLAADEHADVRWFAASNPKAPLEVLEALASDDDYRVRRKVAEHRSSTAVLLGRLTDDLDRDVRLKVAQNRRCPLAALRHLAADVDEHVRKAVAAHPKADDALRLLAVPPVPEPEPEPKRPRAHRRTRPKPTPDPVPTPCDGETCANVVCFGDVHIGDDLLCAAEDFPIDSWSYEGDFPGSAGSFELYGIEDLYWSHDDHGWHAMGRFDSDEEAVERWRKANLIDLREEEAAEEEQEQIREWMDSLEPTACEGECDWYICIDGWHIHDDVIEHMEPCNYFPPDEPMKEDPTHQLFEQRGLYWRSTERGHEELGRFTNDDDLYRAWRDARLRDQQADESGGEADEHRDDAASPTP